MIEIQQKIQAYYKQTEYIRNKRVELRQLQLPKILKTGEEIKFVYSEEYLKIDKQLESLQKLAWDNTFAEKGAKNEPSN